MNDSLVMPDGTPWPRISVVSTWLDAFPDRSIKSALDQGYPNLEYIVVRPGHQLGPGRKGVAIVECEPDAGPVEAINTGLADATGDILTWLHGTELAPASLAAVGLAFHTSGADVVLGACRLPEAVRLHAFIDGPIPVDALLDVEQGRAIHQPAAMFTRELWERTGSGLSTDWRRCWDHDWWLRCAEAKARVHVVGRIIGVISEADTDDADREELPVVARAFCDRTQTPVPPASSSNGTVRVALLSDAGFRDGAGIALRRLGQALECAGHDVQPLAADDLRWTTGEEAADAIASRNPDLVLVGSTQGALAPSMIDRIAEGRPTAILMHDLWMLTGGCRYPGRCTRFITECDQRCTCDADVAHAEAGSSEAWAAKRRVLSQPHAPALLAPSRWVLSQIEQAAARDPSMRSACARIRLGVDTNLLRPRDKATCRELLGLDPDTFIILTAASSLTDERQGLVHLADAIKLLSRPDVQVIAAGRPPAHRKPHFNPIEMSGSIDDPLHMALLYAASDLFVAPCTDESFGQAIIEAAACGTPSVGFPVGGVPEAILDGISGRLSETISAQALADVIAELHGDECQRMSMSTLGRTWVESTHSLHAAAASLIAALHEVGFGARLGLSSRLTLADRAAELPATVRLTPESPFWSAQDGFSGWEGPIAEVKLDASRWALGPVSRMSLHARRGGLHVLALRLRNLLDGQRLRVIINGRPVTETAIPVTGQEAEHLVKLDAMLDPGDNRIELHHWCWDRADEHAVLVTGVHAVRSDGA